ncbi:uncharacterized protein CPUR_02250 [Claviceps purpurea 20.1]|uniref:DDE Tnp4 domain-containing protein n=1 Tax=Claviceps purpurea (strain 20.1) TaxID=1111077 RepID=M1W7P2_CLAP2|nr:uncharacterized protein CPUR_02250 [Claviceps purpurea 20.1]
MSNNMEEDHELLPNCIVFVVLDGVGRKGQLTQNVFAAVKFDLTFKYVLLAGAAGSMNDAQMIKEANTRGLVVPYDGERYHIRDLEGVDIESLSMKERFNRHHAGMRSVVERVFGILKKMFSVLKGPARELNWDQQRCTNFLSPAQTRQHGLQRIFFIFFISHFFNTRLHARPPSIHLFGTGLHGTSSYQFPVSDKLLAF